MAKSNCPSEQVLSDYLLGKLYEGELQLLDQHLAECSDCLSTVHALEAHSDTLIADL